MIDVMLSTFNGEKYLRSQLDSVIAQTFRDWRLIIRDDGSSDKTPEIIHEYCCKEPERIFFVSNSGANVGPAASFGRLLCESSSPYIMFCDQDDVWLPDKIEFSLAHMQKCEIKYTPSKPILVHTDLRVVSENMTTVSESFWKYQKIDPSKCSLNRLLVQNVITGNTVLINRALASLVPDVPNDAIMHDWWLALVASAFGKIHWCQQPTVLYRQHRKNLLGAVPSGYRYIINLTSNFQQVRRSVNACKAQAARFLYEYGKKLDGNDLKVLQKFGAINDCGFINRRYIIFRYGIYKNSFIKNLGLLLEI